MRSVPPSNWDNSTSCPHWKTSEVRHTGPISHQTPHNWRRTRVNSVERENHQLLYETNRLTDTPRKIQLSKGHSQPDQLIQTFTTRD
ncbi:hypothetical protein BY996DRAFT_6565007 [Phakopsora pachyrhizi]|nr:hypothetical protein BY996DRAFT_6565007 [Phakopsora pachyrhizi]